MGEPWLINQLTSRLTATAYIRAGNLRAAESITGRHAPILPSHAGGAGESLSIGVKEKNRDAGATALYVWWFSLRLIFITFWNSLHDVDRADAREPHAPGEDASGDGEQVS